MWEMCPAVFAVSRLSLFYNRIIGICLIFLLPFCGFNATIKPKHYISVERHHSTHFYRCVSLWRGQNHLLFFDKDMEIFNALSYLSIAGKMDMSIEKTLCEWSWLGLLMLYIDKKFCIMRYSILPAYTTKQEENNVGRDKRGFWQ